MNKKININFIEICAAMQNNSLEVDYFLDLQTGDVLLVSDYYIDDEESRKKIDEEPTRYIRIPTITSPEAYKIMEDFIETVEDEEIKNELYDAITKRKPFYRFKETISNHPEEELKWYDFKERRIRNQVVEWLKEIGIEFTKKESEETDWVKERIKEKREEIDKSIDVFTDGGSKIDGVLEIGLFGEITSEKKRLVRCIDFYVIIENPDCINRLAKLYRKVIGTYHQCVSVSVFTKDKEYLGNICFRKTCPTLSIDCRVLGCGTIKHIRRFHRYNPTFEKISKSQPKRLWYKL